jgi:hypothetical protein
MGDRAVQKGSYPPGAHLPVGRVDKGPAATNGGLINRLPLFGQPAPSAMAYPFPLSPIPYPLPPPVVSRRFFYETTQKAWHV